MTALPIEPQLAEFFLAEVAVEQLHAQFLTNKNVALVLTAERRAVADYTERAPQEDAFGDSGLAAQLEDMVRDESGHPEETERILTGWPL